MSPIHKIIETLFGYFDKKKIQYCVLHSYETLPEYVVSDIDIAIDPMHKNELDNYLYKVAKENEFSIIQKLYYDIPSGFYYVLANMSTDVSSLLQLDFLIDTKGINRYYLKSSDFLTRREKNKSFYVPSHGMQVVYLLIKRTIKDNFSEKHFDKLRTLYFEKPEEVSQAIEKYLCPHVRNEFVAAIHSKSNRRLVDLTFEIKKQLSKKNNSKTLLKLLWKARRIMVRVFNPKGSFICILSPDGGGKSSVAKESLRTLLGAFRKCEYLHWRPEVLPQIRTLLGKSKLENEFIIANPHAPKRQSRITSFLRWMYYTADYIIGYYLKILPMKIKTAAVVIDRYYYDVVVDPVRYGFNLPKWLLKLPLRFIPQPDLTIYLDNEPEEIYKRKQELPVSELKRQVEAWRELIPSLPNARIVTTDKPLNDVVYEVTRLVLERRAEMTRKMLKIDPDESRYLWKSDSTGYIALPSKKNCRWIIPDNPVLAKKAWDLYLPYSPSGKIYKNLYRFISSKGLLRYLKYKKLDLGLVDEDGTLKKILVNLFKRDDLVLAISTGTPGAFRKVTAMILNSEANVLGYVKIGETPLAIERIKNEAKILKLLVNSYQLIEKRNENCVVRVPECLYEGEIEKAYVMVQSPAPFEGKSGSIEFNEDYANVLRALIKNTSVKKKFVESEFYKILKDSVENYPLSYRDIMQRALGHLEENIGDKEITFSLSHGDFAPWNILWGKKDKKEVFLFDWESAVLEAPTGIDFVHFLFQTGFLLKRLKGKRLLNHCLNQKAYTFLKQALNFDILKPDTLLLVYLLKMALKEDKTQQLSIVAVERRDIIKILLSL